MNMLLSLFLGGMGVGLLAMGMPVYDMMVGQTWVQGGLSSLVLFLAVFAYRRIGSAFGGGADLARAIRQKQHGKRQ